MLCSSTKLLPRLYKNIRETHSFKFTLQKSPKIDCFKKHKLLAHFQKNPNNMQNKQFRNCWKGNSNIELILEFPLQQFLNCLFSISFFFFKNVRATCACNNPVQLICKFFSIAFFMKLAIQRTPDCPNFLGYYRWSASQSLVLLFLWRPLLVVQRAGQ